MGDDNNNGMTQANPVKTIKRALQLSDSILLKCDDVFYENVKANDIIISSYGKGKKPKLCGWKRIIKPAWESLGDSIWRISLDDSNYIGFLSDEDYMLNNIGCIHEYNNDSIHGRKVRYKRLLKENWDIWQTEHHSLDNIGKHDFDTLYLRYSGNPNNLKLEFSVGTYGVYVDRSIIENICVEGFGTAGIDFLDKTSIRNCRVDAIGGSLWVNDNEFVCLGNGIESWMYKSIQDCLIEKNIVTRCYDCGMTIQGPQKSTTLPRRIIFRNNFISDCSQGWEDFLNNDIEEMYDNCIFENNIVCNIGKTSGFNYPSRMKYCHVLGNNQKRDRGMIIRNNKFIGGNYYCSGANHNRYSSNIWQNNVCYIKRGDFLLSNYLGTKDVIRIPVFSNSSDSLEEATERIIAYYRSLTGDVTTKFIVMDEESINSKVRKMKRKHLGK